MAARPFLEQEARRIPDDQAVHKPSACLVGEGEVEDNFFGPAEVIQVLKIVVLDFSHGPLEPVDPGEQAAVLLDLIAFLRLGIKKPHKSYTLSDAFLVDLRLLFP